MRRAFIDFDTTGERAKYTEKIKTAFFDRGVEFTTFFSVSGKDAVEFGRLFEYVKTNYDCAVMCAGLNNTYSVKEIITDKTGLTLTESETAKERLVGKEELENYSEDLYLIPEDATVIPNDKGLFQGYMLEADVTLIVISDDENEGFEMLESYVIPYLEGKNAPETETQYFKLYGCPAEKTESFKQRASGIKGGRLRVKTEYGDSSVVFSYPKEESYTADGLVKEMTVAFEKYCYACSDVSEEETLVTLLKTKELTLGTAESFTGGGIASAIVSVPGASAVLKDGIVCYSEEAKRKRVAVSAKTLQEQGAVSGDTAYEMAVGLIRGGVDFAIATTGLAGPDGDGSGKPVGLCYIAVGTKNGVFVGEHIFKGKREEIIKQGVKTALFRAIKLAKEL